MAAISSDPTKGLTTAQGNLEKLEKSGKNLCHLQACVVNALKTRLQNADQANVLEISRALEKTLLSFDSFVQHLKGWLGELGVESAKDAKLVTGNVTSDGGSTDGLVNLKNEVQDLKRTLAEKEISMNKEFRKIQEHIKSVEKKRGSKLENMGEVQTPDVLVFPEKQDIFKESEDSCVNKRTTHHKFRTSENVRVIDLPREFQSNELAQAINMLSKLCVQIKVTSVCNQVRVGSGWVYSCKKVGLSEADMAVLHQMNVAYADGRQNNMNVEYADGWQYNRNVEYVEGRRYDMIEEYADGLMYHGYYAQHQHIHHQRPVQYDLTMCTSDKLVWDAGEVDHIDVTFNLDGQTVTWKGDSVSCAVSDPNCDTSTVTVQCNEGLGVTLDATVTNVDKVVERVNKKFDRGQTVGGLAVLLSNPHGVEVSKIALGHTIKLSHNKIEESEYYQLETTLPTCVGCTGGLVWPVGLKRQNGGYFPCIGIPHCERSSTNTQLTDWWKKS